MRKIFFIITLVLIVIILLIVKISNKSEPDKGYVSIVKNQELVIENILPLADEVGSSFSRSNGKSNVYYKFKIKSNFNKKSNYKILLSTNKGKPFIKDDYIKIVLSDKDDNKIKDYVTDSVKVITGLEVFNKKYVVHSGKLKANGEEEFILRLWVSDAAIYNEELIFDGKLSVYSY